VHEHVGAGMLTSRALDWTFLEILLADFVALFGDVEPRRGV